MSISSDCQGLLAVGLFMFLVFGLLIHYYVILGVKRQIPIFLLPFIFIYIFFISFEVGAYVIAR